MFEIYPSFDGTSNWEDSIDKDALAGKLKFPVTFHEEIPPIEDIPDRLVLSPPRKKDRGVKVVEVAKKSKSRDKKKLF